MATSRHLTRTHLAALAAVTAALALASVGCGASADHAEPETRSFGPVTDRLTISKDSGDLDVRPADVDEVEVTRWFSGRSGIGGRAEATWEFADERLTLTTTCGAPFGDCDVRYEVLVPATAALTIEGENGRIDASGFDTAVEIRSDNGAVSVEDLSGPLTLSSDNGQLRATRITSGSVDTGSENGEVHLSFVAAPDDVAVRTENGPVTVELPDATYRVITNTESDDVRIDVLEDANSPHAVTVHSDNGAITLRGSGGGTS